MIDVGYLTAFLGGVLALLSPCSALLLPAFFAYAFQQPAQLFARTGLFYLGLAAVLVPLGAASTAVSSLFYGHRQTLIQVAGWAIIVLGVAQMAGRGFAFGPAQRAMGRLDGRSGRSVLGLGAVYGLAGFCSGPILGSVLTVAAVSGQPLRGGALLAVYAFGMAAPLFVLALLWDRFSLGRRGVLRGRRVRWGRLELHTTSLISGALFVGIGVLFLRYDGTAGLTDALGLGNVDTEFTLQQWASEVGRVVPDWALLAVVGALAVWWLTRRVRAARAARAENGPASRADRSPVTPDGSAEKTSSTTHP